MNEIQIWIGVVGVVCNLSAALVSADHKNAGAMFGWASATGWSTLALIRLF